MAFYIYQYKKGTFGHGLTHRGDESRDEVMLPQAKDANGCQ